MRKTEPGMSPFWDYIGMKEKEIGEGHAKLQIEITPDLLQRRGVVHGGVLATLIDGAVGSAIRSILSEEQATATIELKVSYIRPARGKYLTAQAVLAHCGKTLAVGEAKIFDSNGKLTTMGTATYMILKKND